MDLVCLRKRGSLISYQIGSPITVQRSSFINGGVSGDTTAGGLERLSWSLTEDISAVVVALGSNDVLRGFPPEITKENLSAIIDIAQSNKVPVLLIGTYAPGNYGEEYKSDFDAIFTWISRKKKISLILIVI